MALEAILFSAMLSASVFATVFFIGWAMLKSQRRKGQHRRAFHGRIVWVWMLFGLTVGSVCAFTIPPPISIAGTMFGMLCGLMIGSIHGAVMLRHFKEPDAKPTN